jgi:hypothetical protein
VGELKSAVVASGADLLMKDYNSGSESEVRRKGRWLSVWGFLYGLLWRM